MNKLTFNPYGLIDFSQSEKYKANFHTHSLQVRVMTENVTLEPEGEDPIPLQEGAVVYRNEKIVDHEGNEINPSNPNYTHGDNLPIWVEVNVNNQYGRLSGSDGRRPFDSNVQEYAKRDIKILCQAEHDACNQNTYEMWPWDLFHVDAEALGMLPVKGTEWGVGSVENHHRIVLLEDLFRESCNVPQQETRILAANERCISHWAHIGRYMENEENMVFSEEYPFQMYIDVFKDFNIVQGMEVFNSTNRHPYDIDIWDAFLMELMPYRPVWAFGNDDFHGSGIATDWNTLFMDRFDLGSVIKALYRGEFTCSTGNGSEDNHSNWLHPQLNSVIVNEEEGEITLNVANTDLIEWKHNKVVIGTGETFNYAEADIDKYVRAELHAGNGRTVLQPFGLMRVDTEEQLIEAQIVEQTLRRSQGNYPRLYP